MINSWLLFFALIFVLALLWGTVEVYRAGYRSGWRDRGWTRPPSLGDFDRDMPLTPLERLRNLIRRSRHGKI